MKFIKVETYLDGERQYLNIVCSKCFKEVSEEYEIKGTEIIKSSNTKCYWCDCCLAGSDHPLFEQKMKENKIKKGY